MKSKDKADGSRAINFIYTDKRETKMLHTHTMEHLIVDNEVGTLDS